ncbi:MAG: hypothetical protein ACI4TM_04980 [Candidatus Cryptobacteroides sp.]
MKRFFSKLAVALVCVVFVSGCAKEGVKGFEGRYSYKISGIVTLLPTAYVNATEQEKQQMEAAGITFTPTVVPLYPEQGQMHINIKEKDDDIVIVTFNDILGNVCVTDAYVDSDAITIADGAVKTAVLTDGSQKIASGVVTYAGSGQMYGNQVIITMEYKGTMVLNGTDMTIVSSSVDCVATRN